MAAFKIAGVIFCVISLVKGSFVVETKSGKVAGVEINSIIKGEKFYSFYSIPYGEPPVGDKKFLQPKPHPDWDDILENKSEKPPCIHFNLPVRSIRNYGIAGSEDCLYLTIHTPKLPVDNDVSLPVIVLFKNEYFKVNYNASKEFGPDFFMKEGVIVVTIQHRLSILGFLSFEDDLVPGNNGIRDVLLALNWIHDNIQSFGGNPKKVTLMGSEGGAVLVDLLLYSPKAKGLFSAVILQSGTVWNSGYLNKKSKERAITLAKDLDEVGPSSSYLLKRFNALDIGTILEREGRAVHADEARTYQTGSIPFGPIVEHDHPDAVITEYPENSPLDFDIPIMMGYNSREAIELTERYLRKPAYLTFADRDLVYLFPYRTNFHFDVHSEAYRHALQEIKDFYFDEGYIKVSVPGEFITYMQDMWVFYPIDYALRKYVNESKAPVYYYTFDYSGDFNLRKQINLKDATSIDGTWGASIGDEMCYLFVCKPIKKVYKKAIEEEDSEEMKVLKNMVRLWSNFAKYGNPTPAGEEFQWTPATKENKECLVISDELEMKTRVHDKVVAFWDEFLEKYEKLAVDGVIKDVKDEL